jgi:hypothetical protein
MTISEKKTRAKADYDAVYKAGFQKGTEQGGGNNAAYEELVNKVEALNTELATSLYGGDTGYRGHYDEFWDAYQENGKRTHYSYAFAGFGWTVDNFKPKYNIVPEHATGMFTQFVKRIDLVSHLESIGITIDLSQVINADNVFYSSNFTRIGEVNFTSLNKISNAFSYCGSLVTIDKIIVTENLVFTSVFVNCKALVNVTFEGVIGQNGLNLQYATLLSKASIENIINHLSTTTSGLSVTLSKTAVDSAFGSTTSAEWTSLIGTRLNWTISLA